MQRERKALVECIIEPFSRAQLHPSSPFSRAQLHRPSLFFNLFKAVFSRLGSIPGRFRGVETLHWLASDEESLKPLRKVYHWSEVVTSKP